MAASKTSPDTTTIPLITHVADGRRRRWGVEGLAAERQRVAVQPELSQSIKHRCRAKTRAGLNVKPSPFGFLVGCSKKQQKRRKKKSTLFKISITLA